MPDRDDAATVDQLRLGAGFHPDERDEIVERLRKLDRRLKRFDADTVQLELSVKGRDSNEQHIVLEARVGGLERFVVTSREADLKDALNDVRDDLWRQLDDALGRKVAARRQ